MESAPLQQGHSSHIVAASKTQTTLENKLVCIFQLVLICRNLLYCSVTLCPLLTPKAARLCLPYLLSFSTKTYKAQILNVHDFTRRGNSDSMYCLELQIRSYLAANLAGCADIGKRGKSSFTVSAEGEV